jgi:hypothetical protein
MADKQPAPQAHEVQTQPGSIWEAQEAILKISEPEGETPETEEATPTEEEESQPEEEDESLEEESEETEEAESEEEEVEEESEDTDEEPEVEADDTVVFEGQEYKIDDLVKGGLRQADYTRKTQALAEQRKGMETAQQQYTAESQAVQAERQQYINALSQIIQSSAQGLDQFARIDWEALKEEDHIEYLSKKDEYREAQEKVRQHQFAMQQAQQRQGVESEHQHRVMLQQEHKALVDKHPDWADDDKRRELGSKLRDYAMSEGYSQEELSNLYDHRAVLMLNKAMKYDALQSSDIRGKKVKNKPKVMRSGKGVQKSEESRTKRKAKMKRLQSTGHVDDAVSILEDMFNS